MSFDPSDPFWRIKGMRGAKSPKIGSRGRLILIGVLLGIALYAFFGCTAEYAVNTCTDLDSITVSDTLIVVHKTDC